MIACRSRAIQTRFNVTHRGTRGILRSALQLGDHSRWRGSRCDPDGNGAHGLNERRSVRSVFVGRDFLDELISTYVDQAD